MYGKIENAKRYIITTTFRKKNDNKFLINQRKLRKLAQYWQKCSIQRKFAKGEEISEKQIKTMSATHISHLELVKFQQGQIVTNHISHSLFLNTI